MSFYKKAQLVLNTLEDRNLINEKINFFKEVSDRIFHMAHIAFQSQLDAKHEASSILGDKKMSSYPDILDILSRAEKAALDSPWRFRELCSMAMGEVDSRIQKWIKERKQFTQETLPRKMRGWIDDHSE